MLRRLYLAKFYMCHKLCATDCERKSNVLALLVHGVTDATAVMMLLYWIHIAHVPFMKELMYVPALVVAGIVILDGWLNLDKVERPGMEQFVRGVAAWPVQERVGYFAAVLGGYYLLTLLLFTAQW